MKKADAILTGDWHLQDKQPIARIDDFAETQWKKIKFISDLQKKHDCPITHSGDLLDNWKPSPMLLALIIKNIPNRFYTVVGNHEIPKHNLNLMHKSGLAVLWEAKKIIILPGVHYGQTPERKVIRQDLLTGSYYEEFLPDTISIQHKGLNVLIWHVMTYQGRRPWPGCTDSPARKLLKQYPKYDLILTGHNHKTFVEQLDGRLLVNPGSIFRLSANQVNHKPSVFLWYAATNTVEQVFLPIEDNVIDRTHIEEQNQKTERITAFIENLDLTWEGGLSFETNLDQYLKTNKTNEEVIQIINESLET